jgi:hypothetical protein
MALVTYDVSAKQIEVKQKMKDRGYHDHWESNGSTTYLPNTTLWKPDADEVTARNDIQSVAILLGVTLIRAVAVPHSPWAGIQGQPHSG